MALIRGIPSQVPLTIREYLTFKFATGVSKAGITLVGLNFRYFERRAMHEQAAARTALTAEARERRLALAEQFRAKAAELAA